MSVLYAGLGRWVLCSKMRFTIHQASILQVGIIIDASSTADCRLLFKGHLWLLHLYCSCSCFGIHSHDALSLSRHPDNKDCFGSFGRAITLHVVHSHGVLLIYDSLTIPAIQPVARQYCAHLPAGVLQQPGTVLPVVTCREGHC